MGKIIIIGTLHKGLTPIKELRQILEKYKPSKVLVEISQPDINNGKISGYPKEMRFAYNWARGKGIDVRGFDYKINILAKGVGKKDEQKASSEILKLLIRFTWKDMNKEKNLRNVIWLYSALVDQSLERKRHIKMLRNIRQGLSQNDNAVILTGCANLAFFEKRMPNASFPFR